MSEYTTIRYDVSEGLATLTINRPEHFNGMTTLMLQETYDALMAAAADPSIRVLVLTGAGDRAFCPGADLRAATAQDRAPDGTQPFHFRVPVLLHEMPAVTIAAVNGACAGAGLGWACGCDLRVAARSAMFNTAFLNVAVAGDMGLPWSLARLLGGAKARELSFFSEKFDADEALRIGLADRVAPAADVYATAVELVKPYAQGPAQALRAAKLAIDGGLEMDLASGLAWESQLFAALFATDDRTEGMAAFVAKRQASFNGQ